MSNSRGFTLIEVIVTLVLMSILAFVFIPRNPVQAVNSAGLSEQLLADIRYAQSLAMTRGERYCISFTASGYQLGKGNTCATPIPHPATGSAGTIPLGSGSLSWANLPNNYLVFSSKGIPYTDATTTLAADATVTIAYSGGTKVIAVSPQTGRSATQ